MSENSCPNKVHIHLSGDKLISPSKPLRRARTENVKSGLSSKDAALLALASRGVERPLNSPLSKDLLNILEDNTTEIEKMSMAAEKLRYSSCAPSKGSTKHRGNTIQTCSSPGIKGKSHLVEALKEAHQTPLQNAFDQIADVVTFKIDKEGKEIRELLLSIERFMEWDQVDAVIEQGLARAMVLKEFEKQAHTTIDGKIVVNFESFSTLLARLEHIEINSSLGDAASIASEQSDLGDTLSHVSDDVNTVFNALLKSTRLSSPQLAKSSGVSLRAVLHWPQLQEAVKLGLVSELVVADLFISSLQIQAMDETSTSCVLMSKTEFIHFSLQLQRRIDQVCEEQDMINSGHRAPGYSMLFQSLGSIVSTLERLSTYVSIERPVSQKTDLTPKSSTESSTMLDRTRIRSLSKRKRLQNSAEVVKRSRVGTCSTVLEDVDEDRAVEDDSEISVGSKAGGIFTKQIEFVSSSVHDQLQSINSEITKYITSRFYFGDSS